MIVKRKMGEPVPDLQQGTYGQFSDAAEINALLHKNCLSESSVSDAGSEAAIQRQLLGNFEDEDEINVLLRCNGQDIEPQESSEQLFDEMEIDALLKRTVSSIAPQEERALLPEWSDSSDVEKLLEQAERQGNDEFQQNYLLADDTIVQDEYQFARALQKLCPFAVIDKKLHIFQSPVFVSGERMVLETAIKRLIDGTAMQGATMTQIDRAIRQLETEPQLQVDLEQVHYDPAELVFRNGVYNVITHEMRAATPSDYFLFCNQTEFWPKEVQSGETAVQFFDMLSNGDPEIERLLFTVLGAMMSTESRFKSFFYLVGPPNTGKSTFTVLCQRLIGSNQCASVPLENLGKEFYAGELAGCRANIQADHGKVELEDCGVLKRLTSGGEDRQTSNAKYRKMVVVQSRFIKLLFAGNSMFSVKDADPAIWTRAVIVPCENPIPRQMHDRNLLEKLWEERNYILSRATEAYAAFLSNNMVFPPCRRAEEIVRGAHFQSKDAKLADFVEKCCEKTIDGAEYVSELYAAYTAYCQKNDWLAETQDWFSRHLRETCNLEKGRKSNRSKFFGIKLLRPDKPPSTWE